MLAWLVRSWHGGSQTRLGVGYFVRLDAAIRERSGGERSLDDVLRVLAAQHAETDFALLRAAVAEGTGMNPDELMPEDPSPRDEVGKSEAADDGAS